MKHKNAVKRAMSILLALALVLPLFSQDVVYAGQTDAAPKTPENIVVKQTGTKGLLLTWKKVEGAKGYEVYKSRGNLGGYKKVKTLKKTKYKDKRVKLGKSGTYKVRAYKVVEGEKVYSSFTYPVSAKVCKRNAKKQNAANPELILDADSNVLTLGLGESINNDYERLYANARGAKKKNGKGRYKPLNKRLRWYSTDPSIVKASSVSKVKAGTKPGRAYIYVVAHNGRKSKKIPVVVKDYAYEKVDIQYAPGELQVLFNYCEKQIRDVCSYYSRHNDYAYGQYYTLWYNGEEYIEKGNSPLYDDAMLPIIKEILEVSPFNATEIEIGSRSVIITIDNYPADCKQLVFFYSRSKTQEQYYDEISPHWYYKDVFYE